MSPKASGGKGPKTKKVKKRKVASSKKTASKKRPSGKDEATESAGKTGGLPPSGMAEDILGAMEETGGATAKEKTSALPAFGLATDILGTGETGDEDGSSDASEKMPTHGLAEDILGTEDTIQEEDQSDSQNGDMGLFNESTSQVVAFVIAEEEYALQISEVLEVTHVGEITRVPNAKKYIRGVVNLRGKIIPVVDLKKRLDLGTVEVSNNSRIIVVEFGLSIMGLLVDRVSQVYRPTLDDIEDPPEEVTSARQNCVRGVFSPAPKQAVFLLDLNRTLLASDTTTSD
jgi:purine-binding chemotaxis protein CheW